MIDEDSVVEQGAGEALDQPRRVCICPGRSITDQLALFRHEAEEGGFACNPPRDAGLMDDCLHPLARHVAQLVQISQDRGGEQLQSSGPRRHGHGVCIEGPPVRGSRLAGRGIKHRHDVPVTAHRSNGKPAADHLAERYQIGLESELRCGPSISNPKRYDLI